MTWRVITGDCVEVMRGMEPERVHAIVTDPPYSFSFMGKEWDSFEGPIAFQRWSQRWAEEALRLLKPGGHILAFGGTRTYHRMVCGLEDAGFEIRDSIDWLYGSGFPKSLNVSKAIDAHLGMERRVLGESLFNARRPNPPKSELCKQGGWKSNITAPASSEAKRFEGFGTALKPAHEPIVLARKPFGGRVVDNVLNCGTGALNIDGCRVGYGDKTLDEVHRDAGKPGKHGAIRGVCYGGYGTLDSNIEFHPSGRWPPNILLTHSSECTNDDCISGCSVAELDRQGGASRFFPVFAWDLEFDVPFLYVAKASSGERNAGVDRNGHPTVKPIALMEWLCRLVTPKGGTILDPFLGSGTTGCAAVREGFDFVGIERDSAHTKTAEQRIALAAGAPRAKRLGELKRGTDMDAGQVSLFGEEVA
jgi:DNA modification methylase